MLKQRRIFVMLVLAVLVALVTAACGGANEAEAREKAQNLAYTTVTHEPTFVFDGMQSTLKLLDSQKTPNGKGWTFTYAYDSTHVGYGDRTGMNVAQVITPHTAIISVENNKVTSAVMDGKWDMINQKIIE